MRIPLGYLADRYGGRLVFTPADGLLAAAPVGLALFNDSSGAVLVFRPPARASPAPRSRSASRSSTSGTPPARQGFALGIYGMGMGGTVSRRPHRTLDRRRPGACQAPFWFAAAMLVAMLAVFWVARPQSAPGAHGRSHRHDRLASLFPGASGRAWALTLFYFMAFGGFVAMFLYLPKLLADVHDLTKTDAGARAAGFALLAVIARPIGGVLADRIGARAVLTVSFRRGHACSRSPSPPPTRRWSR